MTLKQDVVGSIDEIVSVEWNERDGTVVPGTDDVALKNGAVWLDCVVLYADLSNSTGLATDLPQKTAARVVRAYLSTMARLVKAFDGEVRSFDGDRVMGVFVGGSKNTNAGKCALKMKYAVSKIIKPKFEAKFAKIGSGGFGISHCVGLDASKALVVRAGVRGSNDLVFIGTAPNIAAKLSDIRNDPWCSYATKAVHDRFKDEVKFATDGKSMWEAVTRDVGGKNRTLYRSGYTWSL